MTALRNLGLSVLLWGSLVLPVAAAPVSATGNTWAWWSSAYSSPATSNWSSVQFASSFYGPSVTSSNPSPMMASASIPAAAPVAAPAPAPLAYSMPSSPSPAAAPVANAFVNLGSSPYPLANQITTGNAMPWYNSSQIAGFFGGQQPDAQQISAFNSAVMQRVERTLS